MGFIPTRSFKLMLIMALMCVSLMSLSPFVARTLAQDEEATDRPFPTSVATTTPIATPEVTAAVVSQGTSEATAEITATLTVDNAIATADAAKAQVEQLQTENKTLKTELDAAQADNGATTFALVIIGVGVLLAVAVFFGLRRPGA